MNITKIHYDICDSTNLRAREYLKENAAERLLITANAQSAGRGRQGKSFFSPHGTGVYMTFAFKADFPLKDAAYITTAAAAKVCGALEKLTDKRLFIKWVNDIYCDNKKICGILCESVVNQPSGMVEYIIIGVGINLTTEIFPKELSGIAGSLGFENRSAVISAVTDALCEIASDPCDRSFMDYYRTRSMVIGREIICIINGQEKAGRALSIDDEGGLCVQFSDGERAILTSGEISLKVQN
ncbi:MAG: biotin--[Clostridia bacterium]|nr:biotin--[acetyl-CoA-carboxylase] ligase [Clostridia bacterium]